MKINTELERLLRTEQNRPQTQKAGIPEGEGFEDLLARGLARPGTAQAADPQALRALADPLRLANLDVMNLAGLSGAEETDGDPFASLGGGIENALLGFDSYAASLDSSSLKDAWSALQALDGSVAALRQDLGRLPRPDPGLESMVNELEVLTATEKFKFNRGDYLPA